MNDALKVIVLTVTSYYLLKHVCNTFKEVFPYTPEKSCKKSGIPGKGTLEYDMNTCMDASDSYESSDAWMD
jgi:hypothetical protein